MPEVEKAEKAEKAEKKDVAKEVAKEKAEEPKEKAKTSKEEKPEKGKAEEKLGEKKEGKDEAKPEKGGPKFRFKLAIPPIVKNIVISLAIFMLLIVAAYSLASKVIKPFMKTQIEKSTTQKKKAVAKKKAEGASVKEVFLVSDMIINPAETHGTRFLNVTIGLGVEDEIAKGVLEERSPQIRDALISILTTKTIPELVHPDGKEILRREITRKVDSIIAPHHILQVYFVDFVLQ